MEKKKGGKAIFKRLDALGGGPHFWFLGKDVVDVAFRNERRKGTRATPPIKEREFERKKGRWCPSGEKIFGIKGRKSLRGIGTINAKKTKGKKMGDKSTVREIPQVQKRGRPRE